MSTHNICLYKKVKKKYTGCNLKTMEFLDCVLIGVYAVIRSNTVCEYPSVPNTWGKYGMLRGSLQYGMIYGCSSTQNFTIVVTLNIGTKMPKQIV